MSLASPTDTKASSLSRKKHIGRMRDVKRGIRRLNKFMNTVCNLQTALKLVIGEFPGIQGVTLVLGASPIRPRHVYELCFSHGKAVARGGVDFTKSRAAEGLSRKVLLRYSDSTLSLLYFLFGREFFLYVIVE